MLMAASMKGHLAIVSMLLDAGADVSTRCEASDTHTHTHKSLAHVHSRADDTDTG